MCFRANKAVTMIIIERIKTSVKNLVNIKYFEPSQELSTYHIITHSVLGAPVNSTHYIKKIVNCTIKQSGKVHKVL